MIKLFSVYDSRAEAYLTPFFMKSRGEAIRGFTDVCNDPKTSFYKHASDYTLFEIAEYDEFTGTIKPYEVKQPLGTALEYKQFNQQQGI